MQPQSFLANSVLCNGIEAEALWHSSGQSQTQRPWFGKWHPLGTKVRRIGVLTQILTTQSYFWQVCNASFMAEMPFWMSCCSKVMMACKTTMVLYPKAWYMLSLALERTQTVSTFRNNERKGNRNPGVLTPTTPNHHHACWRLLHGSWNDTSSERPALKTQALIEANSTE